MAEKFGVGWIREDSIRMEYFQQILIAENKRAKIENDKEKLKSHKKTHGRHR